jgi:TfoX/Sxy family transcriptional regulator of competence genes
MAYDEDLAERVRAVISARDAFGEREMFGGIGFMVGGNMACGVSGDELMVRLGPDEASKALAEEHVRVFDMTGRPMKGWILVGPEATASDEDLAAWVDAGADFAASLPPK